MDEEQARGNQKRARKRIIPFDIVFLQGCVLGVCPETDILGRIPLVVVRMLNQNPH